MSDLKEYLEKNGKGDDLPIQTSLKILKLTQDFELLSKRQREVLACDLKEAQLEYRKATLHSNVLYTFKICAKSAQSKSHSGRTDSFATFLENRERLQLTLCLPCAAAREALRGAEERVPRYLVTLDEVECEDVLEAARQWREKAEVRADALRKGWPQERRGAGAQLHLGRLLLQMARVRTSQMVRRTVRRLLQTLDQTPPAFVWRVRSAGTEPTEEEFVAKLESFVKIIFHCCRGMLVEDDSRFEADMLARMAHLLDRNLAAPRIYLKELHARFEALTSETKADVDAEERNFDALGERIAFLQRCLLSVMEEPPEETHALVTLRKEALLEELERSAKGAAQTVASRMERLHQRDAAGVCRAFREIAARASVAPNSTAELIAAQNFLLEAQQSTLALLETRISRLATRMARLMRLRCLSNEHCKLNAEALRWLTDIKVCFVESEEFFEQQRLNFERQLQLRTDQLNQKLEEAIPRLALVNDMRNLDQISSYLEETRKLRCRLLEFEEQAAWINSEEALFKFPLSTYPELDEFQNCLLPVWGLLRLCRTWRTTLSKWMDGSFDELDTEAIYETTNSMLKKTETTQQQFREMIKQQIADNNPRRLKGALDDPGNLPAPLQLCQQLMDDIKRFKSQVVLVRILCNRCLKRRHWAEISTLLERDIYPDAGASLKKMLTIREFTPELIQKCEVISFGATKEMALQEELRQTQEEWERIHFSLVDDPERGCCILKQLEELQASLASALLRTQAMRGSAFAKPHAAQLRAWHSQLKRAEATLSTWALVQDQWRRLAPIFECCEDVAGIMPYEAQLFSQVDQKFRELVHEAEADECVMHLAGGANALETLTHCVECLNVVNEGVVRYLGVKRRAFPRFFFLSNEELLSVLSAAPHLDRVAELCLSKIFEAAREAVFDDQGRLVLIKGCYEDLSIEPVNAAPIEKWLDAAQKAIAESLQKSFHVVHEAKRKMGIAEWATSGILQLVLAAASASWTADIEACLRSSKRMAKLRDRQKKNIEDLTAEIKCKSDAKTRTNLSTLLTSELHVQEIVDNLQSKNITSASNFEWLSEIRFYYDKSRSLEGRLMYSSYQYGWEFLQGPYLVPIPSTLQGYRALVSAHQMGTFLNMQGPACSGKSSTFLSLATIFGRFRVAVTCSQATNELTLLRVLQGAAGCGAWCLLDEVHQLTLEVLSVTAQHVLQLSMASEKGAVELDLQGRQPVPLAHPLCLLCVTSKRSQFVNAPNNFKSLFRPWIMCAPDLQKLVEMKLRAAAMEESKQLSNQLNVTLKIAKQRIGRHANFGIRAALQSLCATIEEKLPLDESLSRILLPSLDQEERILLQGVVKDSFGTAPSTSLNLEEALANFSSLIVVGPPGSGKTTAIKKAANLCPLEIICPLALDMERLFGHLNRGVWHDGVVTNALRTGDRWMLFDGPLEAWWSEPLHSALNDFPKLNLVSGEALCVPENVKILFETQDLSNASPSILGRCQCLFFVEVSWKNLIETWITKNKDTLWAKSGETLILALLNWFVPPCLKFVEQFEYVVGPSGIVSTLLAIFAMYLHKPCQESEAAKHAKVWSQAALMLSGAWAFSGPLSKQNRELFDEFYKNLWRGVNEEHPLPECTDGKLDVLVPSEGCLLDHNFVFRFKGSWKYWPDAIRAIKLDENADMLHTTVPTVDTERLNQLMQMHLEHGRAILLRGPRDSGKTTMLNLFALERLDTEKNQAILVRLTHGTSAALLQSDVTSNLSRGANGLGPALDRQRCVVLIDDVGAPIDAGPQELLRQIVDHSTVHESAASVALDNILALGALDESRSATPRLLRHFSVLSVGPLAEESALRIFSSLLGAALQRNGFASDVAAFVSAAAQATLDVVRGSSRLQRPWQPHYALGLNDAHRVVLGCSQILKEDADNKRALVRLWCNEVLRCVVDRYSGEEERTQLLALVESVISDGFKEQPAAAMEQKLGFGRLLTGRYVEVDKARFELLANETVENLQLNTVLFSEAVDHLARICRLLQLPRGHILLLGPLGRGKRSLSKLACQMVGHTLMELKAGYDNWRTMLKKALQSAGVNDKETVLLMGEEFLRDDRLLEDAHCVLSIGDAPGLFSTEERQEITETVMVDAQGGQRTVDLAPLQVYEFFAARCRRRLHLLLCLDPEDPRFQTRLQRYPALLAQCTPVWFPKWPEDALENIAQRHFQEQSSSKLVAICRRIHQAAKNYVHANAANFSELLKMLDAVTEQRRERIQSDRQRYLTGLEKLQLAAEQVQRIQEELSGLQPQLAAAAAETREMLAVIETETRKVSEASLLVRSDEAVANAQAAAAQELKSECETELAQAIPILEDAVAALNTLKPTDITLVKSMKNPPEPIKLVMAAVCVIRNIKPDRLNDAATGRKIIDFWGPSKKLLGDISFLQQLKDFDKDNIPTTVMTKIRKDFIQHPDFLPEVVANASSAAEGLCKWVRAMDMYDAVAKEVAPKKAKLEIAQQEYAATLAVLEEKRAQVRRLENQLTELRAQFDAANAHKRSLESEFQACERKLARAEKLIGGLSGERQRWAATASSLEESMSCLEGDALLGSAAVTYLGSLRAERRAECAQEWLSLLQEEGITWTKEADVTQVLSAHLELDTWHIGGLQRDTTSVQSAVVAWHALRPCVCLDPEHQANAWIRTAEPKLRVVLDWDEELRNKCKEEDVALLIEKVEDPDLLLETLRSIPLRPSDSSGFRVYVTTRSEVSRELLGCVTLVDFTLTPEALEEQLLGLVMAAEQPELRLARQQVVHEVAANKAELQQIEERILSTLSASQGNLLEDEAAVDVLDTSRALSVKLAQRQQDAQQTLGQIKVYKLRHRPLVRDAAAAYKTLTWLPALGATYHFSHSWFLKIFSLSVKHSYKMGLPDSLANEFLQRLCEHVGAALFRKHHFSFLIRLCLDLLLVRNEADEEEVAYFNELNKTKSQLSNLSCFSEVDLNSFWDQWSPAEEPSKECLDALQTLNLTQFQSVLLILTLYPSQALACHKKLIQNTLNLDCKLPSGRLEMAFEHSTSTSPLICVLGDGVDVSRQLFALASLERTKLLSISMNPDKTEYAEAEIAKGMAEGTWICLHNCHLTGDWLFRLERLPLEDAAPGFRLWLTCSPQAQLPIGLVQVGVKVALEEPTALQDAMIEALSKQSHLIEGCDGRERPFCRIAFGLSFLYALLQNRAWTEPITLGAADLLLASQHLWELCRTTRRMPVDAAVSLVSDFVLRGHLSDPWNLRVARFLLSECINENFITANANCSLAQVQQVSLYPPVVPTSEECVQRAQHLPADTPSGSSQPDAPAQKSNSLNGSFRGGNLQRQLEELLLQVPTSTALQGFGATVGCPLAETLSWEAARASKRLETARNCLADLIAAMKRGLIPPALEENARKLAQGVVPQGWMPFEQMEANICDFLHVNSKLAIQSSPLQLPSHQHVWLPGMERPEALFASVMQLESRSSGAQLTDVLLELKIDHSEESLVTVTGLWLDGADYDEKTGHLVELKGAPKQLPAISVRASRKINAGNSIECPIYLDEEKRISIGSIFMPTNNATQWKKRGVSVFLKRRLK